MHMDGFTFLRLFDGSVLTLWDDYVDYMADDELSNDDTYISDDGFVNDTDITLKRCADSSDMYEPPAKRIRLDDDC